jgi:phosphoribosylamine--glycine ligase
MAQLEGSKIYAKKLMMHLGIPTASFRSFDRAQDAEDFLNKRPADHPWVVKADGLAAGKGVMVCRDRAESIATVHLAMTKRAFGAAGDRIIIEERLYGLEVSLIALCHKGKVIPLATAKDYKPVGEGDIGPNTGGMGCFSPAKVPVEEAVRDYCDKFIQPIVNETGYKGTLYAGLMLTDNGPMILEYNVRFGDPETQVILPRMAGDLYTTLCCGEPFEMLRPELAWAKHTAAVTVVMASEGYPGSYRKGEVITGLDAAREQTRAIVFHAGTKLEEGKIITTGGRVLNVTGGALTMAEARDEAYRAVQLISWPGAFYRRDIAKDV